MENCQVVQVKAKRGVQVKAKRQTIVKVFFSQRLILN